VRFARPRAPLEHLGARVAAALAAEPYRVLAGVDEAGLGPVLGPLSIGFAALALPAPEVDPWEALKPVVSRRPSSDRRRLVVADSKLVFARTPRGARRLELTALAFLSLSRPARAAPGDGRALLAHGPLGLDATRLERTPWRDHLPARLPLAVDAGLLEIRVERLARTLAAARLELVAAGTRIVPAAELNASLRATDNKSLTHWDACAPVLAHLWSEHAADGLVAVVDRHGGRMRYGRLLSAALAGSTVEVVREEEPYSEYRVLAPGRRMRVVFSEQGERFAFPTALASCLAKYAREVCMHAFNACFGELQPGLRPTAGYYLDGQRWIGEAGPAIARSGVAREDIVRER
jgi:hypothetical protein